jgi:hypothetical protein
VARARLSPARAGVAIALAAAVSAPFVAQAVVRLGRQFDEGLDESAVYAALPDAIARAGGPAAVLRCGPPPITATYDVQVVARALRVHEFQVGITPRVPGTIVVRSDSGIARDARYPTRTRTAHWVVASSCAR